MNDEVLVQLPAHGAYLAVLRSVTAGLAARLDFTVDEACALLLGAAAPGADLSCRFAPTDDSLLVSVSVATSNARQLSHDSFAWTVLTALAGEVDASTADDGTMTLSMRKQRAGSVAG